MLISIGSPVRAVKVTMFMQQGKYTWSEAHYLLNYFDFPSALAPAYGMCTLRAKCLGNNAALVGCRLSLAPSNRQVYDLNPQVWPAHGSWPSDPGGGNYSSDLAYSALLVKVLGVTSSKNLYFAGVPDNVILTDPSAPDGYVQTPSFATPFYNYMVFIASLAGNTGVGFRSRDKSQDVFSLGLVTNALYPNAIGVQAISALPGIGLHSEVYLSGWRRSNTRIPGLSGAYQVVGYIPAGISGGNDTYFLGETGNVSPTNFLGLGNIGPLLYNYIGYQGWDVRKAVSRKRGGSYGLPRGRSRATR